MHSSHMAGLPVKECMTPLSGPRWRASRSITRMSSSQSRMWTMNGGPLLREPNVAVEIILLDVEGVKSQ